MTIAACYLSSEGVVFGADSTTTMYVSGIGPLATGAEHHFDFAQKIFQIGEQSTLGITMWGLGNLPDTSYRTLIAQFADTLIQQGATSLIDVAQQWSGLFWGTYCAQLAPAIQRAQTLSSQPLRTQDETRELDSLLQAYSGGFCLGGYLMNDRSPCACEIRYDPTMTGPPAANRLDTGSARFWGCPNLIDRLTFGIDTALFSAVLHSNQWTGTDNQLFDLIAPFCLGQPRDLPIREAIDWIHASIYTTIKTMKFSHMAPVCGGPVEIAAITTDRRFRWVRHKGFDAAIGDGGFFDVVRHAW